MKRCAFVAVIALAASSRLAAGQPTDHPLTDKEIAGRNIFAQSCIVCHVKTQLSNLGHYGPELSRMSLGGQEDVMRELISNGTPNMPGFKYQFTPAQIDSIVAYLKTLPIPAPAAPASAPAPH
jgi:mono/diheme cytochrome c family protein